MRELAKYGVLKSLEVAEKNGAKNADFLRKSARVWNLLMGRELWVRERRAAAKRRAG
jgi:hypothetical protein